MKVRFVGFLFLAMTILWGCITDKTPTSAMEDPDPNGEEELLQAFKDSEGAGIVKVMSRNVYIGTDVDDILEGTTPEQILLLVTGAFQEVQNTDFPSRAKALATEIEKTMPHLVGLQEMSKFYIQSPGDLVMDGDVPAEDLYLDFSEVLMGALADKGLNYRIVATVENADVELPMVNLTVDSIPFDDVRIKDHDVILARNDVKTSNPVAVRYHSMLVVEVDDTTNITIPRGYVAVNAEIEGLPVVFANTHIESVPDIDLRMAQVTQLLDAFKDESSPVIIVGDFNSRATTGESYNHVLLEGYTDTWIMNPLTYNTDGYTYGHESNLRNESPNLSIRIDFVFAGPQGDPVIGEGFVLGDEKRDKTENGLWPSDHAGVVTKLTYTTPAKLAAN